MKTIDVREVGANVSPNTIKILFGEHDEFVVFTRGQGEFVIEDDSNSMELSLRDLNNLIQALDVLREFAQEEI